MKLLGLLPPLPHLHERVLLAAGRLHERAHQRVEALGQRAQADGGAGAEGVHAQLQSLPLATRLRHRRRRLLVLGLQWRPQLGARRQQACRRL